MRFPCIVGLPVLAMLLLGACGGGDGSGSQISYAAGVFAPASTFADRCENPRTGFDPATNSRWPDRAGSALQEKHFLRSWTNDLYLWFGEVPDTDPMSIGGATDGVADYFDTLKTTVLTSTGRPKDNFHFTYDTAAYRQLASSGTQLGYGISFVILAAVPPREIVVEYVQAGTPAASGGVQRGATLVRIDSINVVTNSTQAGVDFINEALFDPQAGASHTFEFRDRGSSATRTVTLSAANIAFDAVPMVDVLSVGTSSVGYLLFNDHSAIAEQQLLDAVDFLADEQIDELVLDLRYNGGGYLDIASELAYMIAGAGVTTGRTFERMQFNSKHPINHPLSGSPITPIPFHSRTRNFSAGNGVVLPQLALDRVFVLTSAMTCSASESIINGLRGVGIEVIQIGDDTCGKPYGFYPHDNCGTTYFSIQFRGVNDIGFGDYADGFSATRVGGEPLANLPGCAAEDDLTRDLGNPLERQLQTALARLQTGSCPTMLLKRDMKAGLAPTNAADEAMAVRKPPRLPWRDNRIIR